MIIGLAGKMQTGKDLSALIIQYLTALDISSDCWDRITKNKSIKGYLMSDWKVIKFADKLKDIVCLLLGCTRADLEDRDFKEQELGEEWWQWQDTTTGNIYEYEDHRPFFSRPEYGDCMKIIKPTPRFLLQYIGTDLFRKQLHTNTWVNATMVDYKPQKMSEYNPSKWIISDVRFPNEVLAIKERGGIIIKLERDNIPISNHLSETALDNYENFNYVISNNGTIEELKDALENILKIEGIL